MKILAIGDVIGNPGRTALAQTLPIVKKQYGIDFVIANGENSAGGKGATPTTVREMLDAGCDVITSGNHIWSFKDIIPSLEGDQPIIRPLNYPPGLPGHGHIIMGKVAVINIIGRTFIGNFDCPFRAMDDVLTRIPEDIKIIMVDFHAEATSEKIAMGYYLDGRVSGLFGTHTHVATADERILPKSTGYITDIGMVGPLHSVIGCDVDEVIKRSLTQVYNRLPVAEGKKISFNGALFDIDDETGKAVSVERVNREVVI